MANEPERFPIEIEFDPQEVDVLVKLLEAGGRHIGIGSFGDVAHFVTRLQQAHQAQPKRNEERKEDAKAAFEMGELLATQAAEITQLKARLEELTRLTVVDGFEPDQGALAEIEGVAKAAQESAG